MGRLTLADMRMGSTGLPSVQGDGSSTRVFVCLCLGHRYKAPERVLPEELEERPQRDQAVGVHRVEPPVSLRPVDYQSRLFEDLEVLRDGGAADRQAAGDLDHWLGSVAEALQNDSPGTIPKGVQDSTISRF
jgi:hypothetical protein